MIKKLAIAVVVMIAAVLVFAATRPGSMHVERTAPIRAAPEKIIPFLVDFHKFGSWSPYEKIDPAMKRTYSGAPEGKGAIYEWQGNSEVGAGRMEITDVQPSRVTLELDFTSPLEGHDIGTFVLEPHGNTTNVTWMIDGPTPYIGKLIGLFMNMDTMIGGQFDDGLANLKAIAEKVITMCRNIKTLFNFDPPATDEEVFAASLQFVRKLSGFAAPSKNNEAAFNRAIEETAVVARRLVDSLVTNSPPRDREVEAEKAKARSAERFGPPAQARS